MTGVAYLLAATIIWQWSPHIKQTKHDNGVTTITF